MTYLPEPGTLPARVCAFFTLNPEEALSAADIALKFDVPANHVGTRLADALTHKLLERFRAEGSLAWQYRAGRNIAAASPPAQHRPDGINGTAAPFPASPLAPPVNKRGQHRNKEPLPDELLSAVESGVPMPAVRTGVKRRTNWSLLFERMDKPGLCSSLLPLTHRIAAISAIKKRKELQQPGTFIARRVSDTHFRIWRTA